MNAISSSEEPSENPSTEMRLQRYLAQCGLGSRRECEEYISAGRVSIDGQAVTKLGSTVDPVRQNVLFDGERLRVEHKRYYMLNKPPGFLCTARDPQGRPTVLQLFPDEGPRLFNVGRLDENTTGLLVVTNDGDLAQKLAHPRYRIYRLYRAQVAGSPGPEVFQQLKQGLFFTEGKFRVHDVKPVKRQKGSTWVEITMREGQNREIRRLFARLGHKVMKLERLGFGPLRLGRLPLGAFRELRKEELAELHSILHRNMTEPATTIDESSTNQRPGRSAPGSAKKPPRGRTQGSGKPRGAKRPTQSKGSKNSGGAARSAPQEGRKSGHPAQKRTNSSASSERGDRASRTSGSERGGSAKPSSGRTRRQSPKGNARKSSGSGKPRRGKR